jgi:hypothetical protein
MLTGMQAYSIAFSAAVLWLLTSLGSLQPGVAILLGAGAVAAILLVGRLAGSEEGGQHKTEAAQE